MRVSDCTDLEYRTVSGGWGGRDRGGKGTEGSELFLLADSVNSVLAVSNRFSRKSCCSSFRIQGRAGSWPHGDFGLIAILALWRY